MGCGFRYHCKSCNKVFDVHLGVGFAFPRVYEFAIKGARKGRYGREWKQLTQENDRIAIDAEEKLYRCDNCGHWETDLDLSLYVPKSKEELQTFAEEHHCPELAQIDEDASYVAGFELDSQYKLLKPREHLCSRCHQPMSLVRLHRDDDEELEDAAPALQCNDCGSMLSFTSSYLWD